MRLSVPLLRLFAADRRGATSVEYGLILAMIFLAMAASIANVGNGTSGMWNKVSTQVQDSANRGS